MYLPDTQHIQMFLRGLYCFRYMTEEGTCNNINVALLVDSQFS